MASVVTPIPALNPLPSSVSTPPRFLSSSPNYQPDSSQSMAPTILNVRGSSPPTSFPVRRLLPLPLKPRVKHTIKQVVMAKPSPSPSSSDSSRSQTELPPSASSSLAPISPSVPPLSREPSPVLFREHNPMRASTSPQLSLPQTMLTAPTFFSLLTEPSLLSKFLPFLHWQDFLAVCQSCRTCRDLFEDARLKDAILTRYVEGYGYCLRNADPSLRDTTKELRVTVHDLDSFLISQSTPLHTFPTHALASLTSPVMTPAHQPKTLKLIRLAYIHSHFVLLVQALAHSSSQPIPAESDPESPLDLPSPFDAHAQFLPEQGRSASIMNAVPRFFPNELPLSNGHVKELKFPAPLSYNGPKTSAGLSASQPINQQAPLSRLMSQPVTKQEKSPPTSPPPSATGPRITRSRGGTIKKRLSILGPRGNSSPLPAPQTEPFALKYYASSWRRTTRSPSTSGYTRRQASIPKEAPASDGWTSEDDFRPPKRPNILRNHSSSDVSRRTSSSTFCSNGGTASSAPTELTHSTTYELAAFHPSTNATSPHDIILATSRLRAPVLRVFFPCTHLTEDSIKQCEDQLIDSGLWDHLSTGDIVCNLGYVPMGKSGGSGSTSEAEEDPDDNRRIRSAAPKESRKWLLFNGEVLVPFTPAEQRLPLDDPLSLPSPWFYEHLMPTDFLSALSSRASDNQRWSSYNPIMGSTGTGLVSSPKSGIFINRLPPPGLGPNGQQEKPQLMLVNYTSLVRSPHSKGGFANANRWAWIAKVYRGGDKKLNLPPSPGLRTYSGGVDDDLNPDAIGMGIGWEGEWILEGEGTKEGRQMLLSALSNRNRSPMQWEFIREKSGGGRIWLKLLPSMPKRNSIRATIQ